MTSERFQRLIRYPRWEALLRQIRFCQQISHVMDEPHCLALEGISGVGKSTVMRRYADDYPRRETPYGTRKPVVQVETPCPATIKAMGSTMLAALGDPAAYQTATWAINARLIHHLRACEVELVILDDFHHLIDTDRGRVFQTVSEWLKVVLKETGIPFVVVGMPETTERIFRANPQLSRLFHVREQLIPLTEPETLRFFQHALEALELILSEGLVVEDIAHRVFLASNGIIGHLMGLLRSAAMMLWQSETAVLTASILSRAYSYHLAELFPQQSNPFENIVLSAPERSPV
jgi:Bacterial TniB protein